MLTIWSASLRGAPESLLLCAAIVAFLGYPAAFIYSLSASQKGERARRALTTISAIGTTIAGLLTIARAVRLPDMPGAPSYWAAGIAALVISENLLLIELLRRLRDGSAS